MIVSSNPSAVFEKFSFVTILKSQSVLVSRYFTLILKTRYGCIARKSPVQYGIYRGPSTCDEERRTVSEGLVEPKVLRRLS